MARSRAAAPHRTLRTPRPGSPSSCRRSVAHSAGRFADRLAPLGLKPPHAGVLRVLDRADGLSQQAAR